MALFALWAEPGPPGDPWLLRLLLCEIPLLRGLDPRDRSLQARRGWQLCDRAGCMALADVQQPIKLAQTRNRRSEIKRKRRDANKYINLVGEEEDTRIRRIRRPQKAKTGQEGKVSPISGAPCRLHSRSGLTMPVTALYGSPHTAAGSLPYPPFFVYLATPSPLTFLFGTPCPSYVFLAAVYRVLLAFSPFTVSPESLY